MDADVRTPIEGFDRHNLRIGGLSQESGRIRVWTTKGRGGWPGFLMSAAVDAVIAGIIALFAAFVNVLSAAAVGLILAVVWIGASWRVEYELSFARGYLVKHVFICGFRVRTTRFCGPATTYMLSQGITYDEGREEKLEPPPMALVGVEIEKGGSVRRTLVLYGDKEQQFKMLEELAATLNVRNRIGLEDHPVDSAANA